jgi:monofunctional biosynthetic peptidoglycan transglycosylase
VLLVIAAVLAVVALLGSLNPPTTPYMWSESRRLGGVDQAWVPLEDIAPAMARSAVAAEDAGFCAHWGLDLGAIRAAMADGTGRGASTISQQVAKNVFLWHGRSWARKALEAGLTPIMEAFWSKRRILEVYLNVAEFGEGVFGVEAAARHHFGVSAAELSDVQAARLAAILPAPKLRDPANPSEELRARAARILDGAATIAADGRSACFEGPGP